MVARKEVGMVEEMAMVVEVMVMKTAEGMAAADLVARTVVGMVAEMAEVVTEKAMAADVMVV